MKDYPIFTVIIFFLFTSLNCAEGFKDTLRSYLRHSALVRQLSGGEKTNDRRASGMLALPRVGRAPNYARPDGVAGLVQYPRVGRSGQAVVNNLEKIYSVNNDMDSSGNEAHQSQTIDLDLIDQFDGDFQQLFDNNGPLIGLHQKYPIKKDALNRFTNFDSQIDGAWAFIISPPRDYSNIKRQKIFKFNPQIKTSSDSESIPTHLV